MNQIKQPRHFIGETVKRAARNGYNVNRALATLDGDDVVIHAIDAAHDYPFIGEVHDYNVGVSWLARWNEAGQYKGTLAAASKHSFERNEGLTVDLSFDIPKRDAEFDKGFAEATANKAIAEVKRPSLKEELGLVYASALGSHSLMEVAAVCYHVDELIEKKRLLFPEGLGRCEYNDLVVAMRLLVTHPDIVLAWEEIGYTALGVGA
jgi:hypothetical protein